MYGNRKDIYLDFREYICYITSLDRKIEGAIVKECIYVPGQFCVTEFVMQPKKELLLKICRLPKKQ